MLITDTIDKALTVCTIIYYTKCLVFTHHLRKCLGNLILITLLHCFKSLAGIWCGKECLRIKNRICFCRKAVTSLYAV